ncbi:MAG: cytochrome c [Planctomycetes bacterium]|nr:cytochrome c [Planctomycetota bacterium]
MSGTLTLTLLLSLVTSAPATEHRTPPFVAGYDRFYHEAEKAQQVGGDLLISELSCAACHVTDSNQLDPKRGPRLDGAGFRLQRDWMRRYIADPHSVKPGTTMPDVLHLNSPEETNHVVQSLVAFLSTQRKPFPELVSTAGNPIAFEFWKKGNRDRGQRLYHEVGCVACHEPDAEFDAGPKPSSDLAKLLAQLEPEEIRELGLENVVRPVQSVPHGDLAAKYTRESLTYFLLDPHVTRPSGRMPSLKLKPDEAADIASYLLRGQEETVQVVPLATDEGLIEDGRRSFVELRCANCHDVTPAMFPRLAKPLAQLDIDADLNCVDLPGTKLPFFATSAEQTAALRLAVGRVVSREAPRDESTASQTLHFQMMQLNCYACHERDKQGGIGPQRRAYFDTVGHVDLGDEGRLPPPLDGVGRKLTQAWFKKVFEGSGDVRPHMSVRMPKFAKPAVASIPNSFAALDAAAPAVQALLEAKELSEAGRALLNLGCVQCHPMRGEYLPGVVGVDLAGIGPRVQSQWFRDFLLNPAQLKSRTRMPTFFPNGRSGVPTILGGDVERQIVAMWTYLNDIDHQPLPGKLVTSKVHNFELVPKDRPLLLRTFMKTAGTHAIAVGFPQRLHIAFDAEAVRIAQAWRGRFLDAHGTWFDRFTPPAMPLSNDVVTFPPGMPFALLDVPRAKWPIEVGKEAGYRFRGYRLDASGVPTFLYQFGQFDIEDRFKPTPHRTLIRRWTIRRRHGIAEQTLWFRASVDSTERDESDNSYPTISVLKISIDERNTLGMSLQTTAQRKAWVLPITLKRSATIEVTYEW